MRIPRIATVPLIAVIALAPARSSAQISANIQIGPQYRATEVHVYPYSQDVDGDWRASYRSWRPVTLYNVNGRFFTSSVPGARVVQVYNGNGQYFLPPRDPAWVNFDRRYRYDARPRDEDYNIVDRVVGVLGQRPPRTWGSEIVVNPYNPAAYGDWRTAYRGWRPVTVYFRDGRYFSRAVPGARPVALYSWNSQYFLPPQDRDWNNFDRRYNYARRPVDEDYRGVGRVPGVYEEPRRP